jgi:hypothetical protein
VPLTFFEVDSDPDRFQSFLLEDASVADRYEFDGRPLAQVWRPPAVYSHHARLPEGDFWDFGLGAFGPWCSRSAPRRSIGISFGTISRSSASQTTSRAGRRRLRADPRRGWARR